MQDINAKLAALVGSRLCHDLISPVGAIQNGLELMALSGSSDTAPEMALIQDSCASATARIRFFRVAFGSAGDAQRMGAREVISTLSEVNKGTRLIAEWQVQEDVLRRDVQLVYLAILCCEAALPQGGTLQITKPNDRWIVEARSVRVNIDPALWDLFASGATTFPDITPDRVQFALLTSLARERGQKLVAHTGSEALRIEIH